jgi:hypothetical protein
MELGEIQLKINLIVPSSLLILKDKEKIAQYLNEKLYNDPEFFNEFNAGNVSIISTDIEVDGVAG